MKKPSEYPLTQLHKGEKRCNDDTHVTFYIERWYDARISEGFSFGYNIWYAPPKKRGTKYPNGSNNLWTTSKVDAYETHSEAYEAMIKTLKEHYYQ